MQGSHDRHMKMDKSTILTAYKMLESALIELYDDKAENLKQTVE